MSPQARRRSGARPGALMVAFLLVAIVGGVIGGVIANAINSNSASPNPNPTSSASASTCSVTTVARKVLPSVVTISVRGPSAAGTGTGEIIRSDGYILTNNHVIAPAASGGSISVRFNNGESSAATLVGRDPLTDIAVIKVSGAETLPAIPIGTSGSVEVGQPVVVLGAPLGLSSTVTSGIVSALDRTVNVPGEGSQSALLIDALQTDAAINPGNSGGSMVNCAGSLIGVPSAGASVPSASGETNGGSIGLGFAIPVDLAIAEADEIIATGRVVHAYLGLQATPVSTNADKVDGNAEGLLVTGVDPAGPAQAAGLLPGDVITGVDGQPAVSTDQLELLTLSKPPGTAVKFAVLRNGAETTLSVTLAPQPSS
jgi:putative serine protease PepD